LKLTNASSFMCNCRDQRLTKDVSLKALLLTII
jgi:hypothetical protein